MRNITDTSRGFCCVNCVYEPSKDLGVYPTILKNGRMRILLKPITSTMFVCAKCGGGHYAKDFVTEERSIKFHKRKREKDRAKRVETLKQVFTT